MLSTTKLQARCPTRIDVFFALRASRPIYVFFALLFQYFIVIGVVKLLELAELCGIIRISTAYIFVTVFIANALHNGSTFIIVTKVIFVFDGSYFIKELDLIRNSQTAEKSHR